MHRRGRKGCPPAPAPSVWCSRSLPSGTRGPLSASQRLHYGAWVPFVARSRQLAVPSPRPPADSAAGHRTGRRLAVANARSSGARICRDCRHPDIWRYGIVGGRCGWNRGIAVNACFCSKKMLADYSAAYCQCQLQTLQAVFLSLHFGDSLKKNVSR